MVCVGWLFSIGYLTLGDIVAIVCLGNVAIRIDYLTHDVVSRGKSGDVDPLAIQVPAVEIATVHRNSLRASSAAIPRRIRSNADAVFQTEAGLMSLGHCISVGVKDVVVYESLKRVVVLMTIVPNPIRRRRVRNEVVHSEIHGQAVESQQLADAVGSGSVGGAGQTFVVHCAVQVVHAEQVYERVEPQRILEVQQTWNQIGNSCICTRGKCAIIR